jgi:hypothetical protein
LPEMPQDNDQGQVNSSRGWVLLCKWPVHILLCGVHLWLEDQQQQRPLRQPGEISGGRSWAESEHMSLGVQGEWQDNAWGVQEGEYNEWD